MTGKIESAHALPSLAEMLRRVAGDPVPDEVLRLAREADAQVTLELYPGHEVIAERIRSGGYDRTCGVMATARAVLADRAARGADSQTGTTSPAITADLFEALSLCVMIMPRYASAGRTAEDDEELRAVLETAEEAIAKAKGRLS